MLTFTILLGDRSADRPELSLAEASEMASIGFRFAEFRPETGKFRLSPAYRTLHNLDRGTLSLYLLRQLSFVDALRLGMGMMLGNWRHDDVLEVDNVRALTIRTRHRRVRVMLDGEIELLDGPLSFRSLPMALSVLAPPAVEAAQPALAVAQA